MIVIHLVHDFGVNVGELDIGVHAVFSEERDHWLKLKKHALLVDLEVGLRLAQVVKLRDYVIASAGHDLEFQFFHFGTHFLKRLAISNL